MSNLSRWLKVRNWRYWLFFIWVLFALLTFARIFFIHPLLQPIRRELDSISSIVIGKSGSYLHLDNGPVDCQKSTGESGEILCSAVFEEQRLLLRLAPIQQYSYPEYSASCQGTYGGDWVTCWPLASQSNNAPNVMVDGRLGISEDRWLELYNFHGHQLPPDLESWVPLTALLLALLVTAIFWLQTLQGEGVFFQERSLLTIRDHTLAIGTIAFVGVIFLVTFFNVLVLAWDIEDFLLRLSLG